MAADAEQINTQIGHREGDVAGRLGGVAVEQHPLGLAQGCNGLQGRHNADLVVGGHHREQQHVGAQGLFELLQVHLALGADRQQGERKAVALQVGQGIQDCPVLTHHAHQAPPGRGMGWPSPSLESGFAHPFQGQVVGFGGPTGEDHHLGAGPQGPGHLALGHRHGRCRF